MNDYNKLSLEEKIRYLARMVKLEMTPERIAKARSMSVPEKMEAANELFVQKRRALFLEELQAGKSPEEARLAAARRLLNEPDDK